MPEIDVCPECGDPWEDLRSLDCPSCGSAVEPMKMDKDKYWALIKEEIRKHPEWYPEA